MKFEIYDCDGTHETIDDPRVRTPMQAAKAFRKADRDDWEADTVRDISVRVGPCEEFNFVPWWHFQTYRELDPHDSEHVEFFCANWRGDSNPPEYWEGDEHVGH